jgi:hypothetical protein
VQADEGGSELGGHQNGPVVAGNGAADNGGDRAGEQQARRTAAAVAPEWSNLRALVPLRRARNQQPSGHSEGDRWYMPVQPEGQPERDSSVNEPHRHRQVAESFGVDAERYDRARPSYPAALVERIVAASAGRGVLDVGCRTGIAARQFQAAGCRVLGVDPDARMADLARQSGVEVEVAASETWDPAGRAFDADIAAQA